LEEFTTIHPREQVQWNLDGQSLQEISALQKAISLASPAVQLGKRKIGKLEFDVALLVQHHVIQTTFFLIKKLKN